VSSLSSVSPPSQSLEKPENSPVAYRSAFDTAHFNERVLYINMIFENSQISLLCLHYDPDPAPGRFSAYPDNPRLFSDINDILSISRFLYFT